MWARRAFSCFSWQQVCGENGVVPQQHSRAAVDALSELYVAEEESLIRLIPDDLPALTKCSDHVQGIVAGLRRDRDRRSKTLAWELGASEGPPKKIPRPPDDPLFRLLSARFFLLKVGEAQSSLLVRYTSARTGLAQAEAPLATWLEPLERDVAAGLASLDRELAAMGLDRPEQ